MYVCIQLTECPKVHAIVTMYVVDGISGSTNRSRDKDAILKLTFLTYCRIYCDFLLQDMYLQPGQETVEKKNTYLRSNGF